ncbi:MAG TPA: FAD-dependent oxidoreductase [Chthoniobacterales bacterium]|jgi:D-amino-acid oxidase
MPKPVAIIGAGVSGLTCGVLLAEAGWSVRIFAAEIGSSTTSAVAAAIWFPYDAEPADKVIVWALETFEVLRRLCAVAGSGVSMLELRQCARDGTREVPPWAVSLGARRLASAVLPQAFASGYALNVPLTDTSRYLDYLAARFHRAGGEIESGIRFENLAQVSREYSLVVNCTGVGARALLPDPEVEPHRGQVVIVSAIPQDFAIVCDDSPLMYAIPRGHDCVLGGTNEISFDPIPDRTTTRAIVGECSRVLEIAPPEIVAERVGLRPFRRAGVCLRKESLGESRAVIHNYGHGGAGFTLSWGCARAVLALATLPRLLIPSGGCR